jgi:hypothetical protein
MDANSESWNPALKPHKITVAVLMLWISLGLGVVRSAWEMPAQVEQNSLGFVIFVIAVTLLFTGFFIWRIDRGKNWARITYLVLFILGAPFSIYLLIKSMVFEPISDLISIVQFVLQIIALVFLFQKNSNAWFKLQTTSQSEMRLLLPVGRSGWAIAAGYLGIFSLILLPAPVSLLISIIAIFDIRKSKSSEHPKHGMGRAIFGLLMGIVGTAIIVFFISSS